MTSSSRIIALLLALLVAPSFAATTAQDELKRFVDGVQTLQADFTQIQVDDRGKQLSMTSGHMWLSRPGKFRWSYQKPYQQLMVCDGKKIWFYDNDLSQVTVRPVDATLRGTPADLLSQKATLSDGFNIEDGGMDGGNRLIRLKPKSQDSDFKAIELWLGAGGAPTRMKFLDQLGGNTDVSFSQIVTNKKIDDAQFRFTPPKGVEVIDGAAQ
ncbi:outer membrane lipoprotein chaperone LolA [Stenotrophobium rhamnosiphilum]|uniref:Outer-membrane lipoprotein carrier protein n=1 Tax=Stenotrophobium rhamnosiphilum TaxID=2029166 RepID=A0A2T5ME14_9GAMM|nr:outer membrane lipoprotein chaperone LolA [Stenotrophobium rhamnosiphilum]PTU30816.1 outer membrane lipoprotein carrier protein LolA [Stenotrophobium rhamnosiphilum]